MKLSIILLAVAVLGVLGGAALIGLPVLGGAIIFESLCAGAWAIFRDDGNEPQAKVRTSGLYMVPSVQDQLRQRKFGAS